MMSFSPDHGLWYPLHPHGPHGLLDPWAISSAGERPPHTREVVGSNPTSPTTSTPSSSRPHVLAFKSIQADEEDHHDTFTRLPEGV